MKDICRKVLRFGKDFISLPHESITKNTNGHEKTITKYYNLYKVSGACPADSCAPRMGKNIGTKGS